MVLVSRVDMILLKIFMAWMGVSCLVATIWLIAAANLAKDRSKRTSRRQMAAVGLAFGGFFLWFSVGL